MPFLGCPEVLYKNWHPKIFLIPVFSIIQLGISKLKNKFKLLLMIVAIKK